MTRRQSKSHVLLCCLLLCASIAHSQDEDTLPHVDDCSLCMDCVVDAQPNPEPIRFEELREEAFQPQDVREKQQKPFCMRCRGCSTSLQVLVKSGHKKLFNTTFQDEAGASSNWLFVAPTTKTPNGKAIVKVSCIPVGKTALDKFPRCMAESATQFAKIYYAIEKVAEECGLTDVVPKVWVERVNGVVPGVGYHVRWLAVWMEQAGGISLENIVRLGNPMMHPDQLLAILHDTLNHTQVVRSAIFDLLTSQSDRHAQNIFIHEDGSLKLIDNERAFYENNHVAADSILLPTTKKFMINVLENGWVMKLANWSPDRKPQAWANVALLFDYRCYVPNNTLGRAWPADVGRCLDKFHSLSAEQIHNQYGFPSLHTALALKNRTAAMLEQGFEYALTEGYPRNPNAWRYKFEPPCCKIKHTDTYRCAHEWNPNTELPYGDAIGGGPWKLSRQDPGTYEGGSAF